MADKDNLFGHNIEVENVDSQGNPVKNEQEKEDKSERRHWKKFEKSQRRAGRAFIKIAGAAGITAIIALALTGVFRIGFWGIIGLVFFFGWMKGGRRGKKHHGWGDCHCRRCC